MALDWSLDELLSWSVTGTFAMRTSYGLPFSGKTVPDIYLNIGHFLDHFIMLIFAKAAYDAGREFGLGYDEIIAYGAFGFILFGGMAPVAAQLADKFSRSLLMVLFHFGIGLAAIIAGYAQSVWQLSLIHISEPTRPY